MSIILDLTAGYIASSHVPLYVASSYVRLMHWLKEEWTSVGHASTSAAEVAFLTAAARAGWGLAYWAWRFIRFYITPAVAQLPVDLGKLKNLADQPSVNFDGVKVYCQIVRFGADDYIQNLASEQEKFEGRLQNRVMPIPMAEDDIGYRGQMLLPVHRRLGTQFKMFLLTASSDQARMLMQVEYFREPLRNAKRRGRRISFTLKDVDQLSNTEGSTINNIMYPSNLHDFAQQNSFGWAYMTLQRWRWRYAQMKKKQL